MSEIVLWTALCRAVENYARVFRIKVARLQKDAMSLADHMAMFKNGLKLESAKAVNWDSVARGPFQDLEHSSNMQLHWISRKGPSNQDLKGNCPIRSCSEAFLGLRDRRHIWARVSCVSDKRAYHNHQT